MVLGSLLAAPVPLVSVFLTDPGSAPFYLTVALAGALANAAFPLLIVSAQDLAPDAVATASGMLMGLTVGIAGVLYVAVGRLQDSVGFAQAMGLSYLTMIPAGILAFAVLTRSQTRATTGRAAR